ncbi:MAG: hypothetical protein AB1521_16970 [Bacteroidota bacterium]
MKKTLYLFLPLLLILVTAEICYPQNAARRMSTKVSDVFEPYTADDWIISPNEEPNGPDDEYDPEECDIYGVISCYDNNHLRVDILLTNNISFDWLTVYAIKLEYEGMNEYYTYHTDSKELIYEKEVDGKIVKTERISSENGKDVAGVSNSGEKDNADVYFIINKDKHIGGEKGKRYYLTCKFFSGYMSTDNELTIADETIPVELEFEF